ncbi:MAG: bifunctional phosphopantothenoylcysteine decarboxylase/phosphopantothenate--cysteine ligase CoaBC [Vampirovibrionales bacterium]|nr:bifunctional phosphopantothenoylcysteine decarboxylase/phosphopantothenate--cysteine ligase CoaBC [Vampirovibrionales bacterium]
MSLLQDKTIALGIGAGVAAYRACDLIRELDRQGVHRVLPLLGTGAEQFMAPLTLEALTGVPVWQSVLQTPLWHPEALKPLATPAHVLIAQQADALVILPATANLIAKLANGLADCPVSLAATTMTSKPIILMPAMNTRMWENPAVQRNLATLAAQPNLQIISPTEGLLSCGETGTGHLAPQAWLFQALYRALSPLVGKLKGQTWVVTAGGTQEPLDAVRVLTNRSSGQMGLAMADALDAAGATVTLITSQSPKPERFYTIQPYQTTHALEACLMPAFEASDGLVMAAAVADFRLSSAIEGKFKKQDRAQWDLSLTPTPDLLMACSAKKKPHQFIMGFAAETHSQLHENAAKKLAQKQLDALFANAIDVEGNGFEATNNAGLLLLKGKPVITLQQQPKAALAHQILQAIVETLPA